MRHTPHTRYATPPLVSATFADDDKRASAKQRPQAALTLLIFLKRSDRRAFAPTVFDKRRLQPESAEPMRWPHIISRLRKHAAAPSTNVGEEEAPDIELAPHLALGRRGELLAARHLTQNGYLLVASNFKINAGRNRRGALVQAEIDLIAYDGATLCFVEVKTRASDWYAPPEANVDLRKQRQITRAARAYLRTFGLLDAPHRYDVLTVILPPSDPTGHTPPPRIELLKNFWTDRKFRRPNRHDTAFD